MILSSLVSLSLAVEMAVVVVAVVAMMILVVSPVQEVVEEELHGGGEVEEELDHLGDSHLAAAQNASLGSCLSRWHLGRRHLTLVQSPVRTGYPFGYAPMPMLRIPRLP